ncbi:threonine/serine exporter family protein [Clostridium sp. CX1]|uniref:threonine/serine exporter family protein n=1 Tax=Clostridium sp. CX1 TaxID=2978346 RepID=UPI0021BF46F8|nr:threonine/serine exporter family protein [Clostridium sp. CX1]MCT8975983.1 threonine/serine exporter family protein [Clostridium sp. CX1]
MILSSIYTFIATLSFSILANIRGKNLIFASLGGGITWFLYLFTSSYLHIPNTFCFFIASIFASAYSEIMARVLKAPVTTFIISSIIPLVPGGGMYYTMYETVQGNINSSLALGIQTIAIAGTVAVTVFLVSSISKTMVLFRVKLKSKFNKSRSN